MPSIHLVSVSFAYDDARPILRDIDIHLEPGFHGLVGANGAGKSTLLSLLLGARAPTRGHVRTSGDPLRVAWVPQDESARTAALDELASRTDGVAVRWRAMLDVCATSLARWETLSPGARMRFHLCAALAAEPDVLLLDEPTNHIDATARERIAHALSRFRGIGVLVSHDRAWLDALCTRTIWLEDGTARVWEGGYSAASEGRALAFEAARSARALARAEVTRLARATEALQRERASAEAMKSAKRRQRGPKDSDARGILATTRVAWAEARLGRSAGVRRGELERAEARLEGLAAVRDPRGSAIAFAETPRSGPVVFSLDGRDLHAGEQVVLRDVRVTVRRGDRLFVRGDNGAGKTTLLRALVGEHARTRVLYVPQEIDAGTTRAHQRALRELAAEARGRAYTRLAALGCDPTVVATSTSPSAGEARKLVIAAGLERPLDAIVLDEPTNHLDLPSIERLERALAAFTGALVIVSHDARFAEALCTSTLTVCGGLVR